MTKDKLKEEAIIKITHKKDGLHWDVEGDMSDATILGALKIICNKITNKPPKQKWKGIRKWTWNNVANKAVKASEEIE